MILIRNLRLAPEEAPELLRIRAAKKLRLGRGQLDRLHLVKKSLDARKKDDIHYSCAVAVSVPGDEAALLARLHDKDLSLYTQPDYLIPHVTAGERPVVVGFGPAGMFAALVLSRAGARPLVLERGQCVEKRQEAVERLRTGGILDEESNVQFGEGGAGTFSDGKLNTGIHDPRLSWVLREFAAHGAPESVCWDAKPHIGTDVLVDVVRNLRQEILSLGGEIRFGARMERLILRDGAVVGLLVREGAQCYELPCSRVILAIGHSARDSFEALHAQGVPMEPKPFSMGVRIEHLQSDIDRAQYGRERGPLPPADYSLNVHLPDGSSAYSFCMCPGGQVFAAASEAGGVVTNGMSESRRDGENANAALLVTLHPEDFPPAPAGREVLAGMYWQRELEQKAFRLGGGAYRAPAQLAGDFLAGRPSVGPGRVRPSYRPGVTWCELHELLPRRITRVLEQALPALGKKLKGFDDAEAVLTAPETRSSSPVRILRDAGRQSAVSGLYPCGEGAGYAGGISSAAVDGMRCAEAVLESMKDL